jgi:hypothetical protein
MSDKRTIDVDELKVKIAETEEYIGLMSAATIHKVIDSLAQPVELDDGDAPDDPVIDSEQVGFDRVEDDDDSPVVEPMKIEEETMKYSDFENQCTGCDEYQQLEAENAALKAGIPKAEEMTQKLVEEIEALKAKLAESDKALYVLAEDLENYDMSSADWIAYAKQEAANKDAEIKALKDANANPEFVIKVDKIIRDLEAEETRLNAEIKKKDAEIARLKAHGTGIIYQPDAATKIKAPESPELKQ